MQLALWATIVGGLLIFMALAGSVLARLPFSGSMIYILVGLAVSPLWLHLSALQPLASSGFVEHLTEVVVLVSLFTSGLKLSAGINDRQWLLPVRLATVSMVVTVVIITVVGWGLLGLPLGAALLLAGILAPTDPVLASDVQVTEPMDRDRLRFALTGEGGLNDGTAFPVVMLGLGLLGLQDLGHWGLKWLAVDVVWATASGLLIGALMGTGIGKLVLYLRRAHKEAVGLDDFLALGLIAMSYGVALLCDSYGFLAVFAAGVALRRTERRETEAAGGDEVGVDPEEAEGGRGDAAASSAAGASSENSGSTADAGEPAAASPSMTAATQAHADPSSDLEAAATDAKHAPAFMAHAVLSFNEQVERIGEVAVVIVIGAVMWAVEWDRAVWWFVPLMLLVIRPIAARVGLIGARVSRTQRRLIGWFGIRGIGSLYYLAYAENHGLPKDLAATLTAIVLSVVVTSIVVHGISVTPLMMIYQRKRTRTGKGKGGRAASADEAA
ncbi:MAG: putative Na+/H+ and antiporter, NhaP type [Rhizobacter sp.]|nr:putative Na+/H+ and antiporter, NhaP type [Rhizobacter sp.]